MKITFTIILSLLFVHASISAQIATDTVSLGAQYALQTYYSLDQGTVSSHTAADWDIAFDASGFGSAIRINGGIGHVLYRYEAGDTAHWNNLDTNATFWKPLVNADTSWALGAFNQGNDGNFDLGWGNYNIITHAVQGDSLYILETQAGVQKKIWIRSLSGGVFTFSISDLDGSNELTKNLAKSNYTDKNFGYYHVGSDQMVDLEPLNTSWDLLFTRYTGELSPGVYYPVTGALHNAGVEVAEVVTPNPQSAGYAGEPMSHHINTIGYDWKTFNMTTFQYDLADSTAYFIKAVDGNIWRVVFTAFEGSSTGNIVFDKENVALSQTRPDFGFGSIGLAPNPAIQGTSHLIVDMVQPQTDMVISILDMQGRELSRTNLGFQTAGLKDIPLHVDDFDAGIYFVRLQSNLGHVTQKLLVH